jgi:hypothetical protein
LLIKKNNSVADQKNTFADQNNNSADHFTNSRKKYLLTTKTPLKTDDFVNFSLKNSSEQKSKFDFPLGVA